VAFAGKLNVAVSVGRVVVFASDEPGPYLAKAEEIEAASLRSRLPTLALGRIDPIPVRVVRENGNVNAGRRRPSGTELDCLNYPWAGLAVWLPEGGNVPQSQLGLRGRDGQRHRRHLVDR